MSSKQRLILLLGIITAVLLDACSKNEGLSTPQSTEVIYSWEAQPVLISLEIGAGYPAVFDFIWSQTPQLVVYSDGRIVGRSSEYIDIEYKYNYWTGTVSHEEICQMLGDAYQLGFFDFKKSDYERPGQDHLLTTNILVKSWENRSVSVDGLEEAIQNFDIGGYSPPELTNTYWYLSSIRPDDAIPYSPKQVSLILNRIDEDNSAEIWPLSEPSLHELGDGLQPSKGLSPRDYRDFLFDGNQAAEIHDIFQYDHSKLFMEGEEYFRVSYRPLFPYEIWHSKTDWGEVRFTDFEYTPTVNFSCTY